MTLTPKLPVKIACPLGAECEQIVGEEIHRCAWLMTTKLVDRETGTEKDSEQCAITLAPDMVGHVFRQVKSTTNEIAGIRHMAQGAAKRVQDDKRQRLSGS